MKPTLHNCSSLYEGTMLQNFNFNITKYADNGGAENKQEVKNYIREYKKRMGYELFLNAFEGQSKKFLNRIFMGNPKLLELAKKIYIGLK